MAVWRLSVLTWTDELRAVRSALAANVISETEIMVTLDLKLLFEKVEALLSGGVVRQAVVCSFPGLLPGTKAALFKMFKSKELARPLASPMTKRWR